MGGNMDHGFESLWERDVEGGRLWALVLAGGDGTRLAPICRARYGYDRPKQFCALVGPDSLLEQTIGRVADAVPSERVVVSTTRKWAAEAAECLHSLSDVRVTLQPRNAGTTAGLLASLLDIVAADPDAVVLVLPSDHHYSNDAGLLRPAWLAERLVSRHPGEVVLLGAPMRTVEPGLGWLVTRPTADGEAWERVEHFVEKPGPERAQALLDAGALANTMVMVARASELCRRIAKRAPHTWQGLTRAWGDPEAMEAAYASLPPSDVSRDLLAPDPEQLRALPLMDVSWSDLGVPERLGRVTERVAYPGADPHAAGERSRTSEPPGPATAG